MKHKPNFLLEISKIKNPEIFIGVVKILNVDLLTQDKEAKDFADLLEETLKAYEAAPRKLRRELLSILRKANKGEN